ncbi:PilZ domain-containing protein [Parablastomonas sp. CN1-191]|uniref:PilZ domain-containing protein n=1 Tax=Parablastomonas sp. CN1-191 TaxID=3400908 RepID=UPI003BF809E3
MGQIPAMDAMAAPRVTVMMRAGKLVTPAGEFLCILRDVSPTEARLRLFHSLPADIERGEIELGSGRRHQVVRRGDAEDGDHAVFAFADGPLDLAQLVEEAGPYPRRHLRLKVELPIVLATLSGARMGVLQDISQLGALVITEPQLPLGARVTISGSGLPELDGKVRWRRRDAHGLVFTAGFRLDELARLAADIQAGMRA